MKTILLASCALLIATSAAASVPQAAGPYNVTILSGGIGVANDLPAGSAIAAAGHAVTLSTWVNPVEQQAGRVVLIALGDPAGASRALLLSDGRIGYRDGGATIISKAAVAPGEWHHLAAVSDGRAVTLYLDGRRVGGGRATASAVDPRIAIAPAIDGQPHFGGQLVDAAADDRALDAGALRAAVAARPDFALVQFDAVGATWPFQKSANIGLTEKQPAWTLPKGRGPDLKPVAKPLSAQPVLQPIATDDWQINGWRLAAAPDVKADGATLSRPGYDAGKWYAATVPGTVLHTLVDRGVYPDPYYGLDNLAIPESLARQDYWYRTSFTVPAEAAGQAADAGLQRHQLRRPTSGSTAGSSATTSGAFIRGQFDVSTPVAGENVIAVRVSPPPHPGIPHEQSIAAGARPQWRPTRDRRADLRRDRGLGLDPRHPRSRHRAVAAGRTARARRDPDRRPACRDRSAAAAHRQRRRLRSPCRSTTTAPRRRGHGRAPRSTTSASKRPSPPRRARARSRLTPAEFRQLHVAQPEAVVAQRLWRSRRSTR